MRPIARAAHLVRRYLPSGNAAHEKILGPVARRRLTQINRAARRRTTTTGTLEPAGT